MAQYLTVDALKNAATFCFICLRNINSTKESQSVSAPTKKGDWCLRNFVRYLRLSPQFPVVSAPQCQDCVKFTDEFHELYCILEETKVLLNASAQKIANAMTTAKESQPKVTGLRWDNLVAVKGHSKKLFENLRAQLVEKATEKLKETPRVTLNRILIQPAAIPKPPPAVDTDVSKPGKSLSCPYCHSKFSTVEKVNFHLMSFHMDHFFPNRRMESVSIPRFREILCHLLFPDLIPSGNGCLFCDKIFDITRLAFRGQYLKMHLIRAHYEVVTVRLQKLQEDPNTIKKLAKLGDTESRHCPCGVYTTTMGTMARHRKKCQQTRGEGNGEDEGSKAQMSCRYCYARITTSTVGRHLVQKHPHLYFKPLYPPGLPLATFSQIISTHVLPSFLGKSNSKCLQCQYKVFPDPRKRHLGPLKLHLISEHLPELERKLQLLLNDSVFMKRMEQQADKQKPLKCNKCGLMLTSLGNLKRHKANSCGQKRKRKIRNNHTSLFQSHDDTARQMLSCFEKIVNKSKNKARLKNDADKSSSRVTGGAGFPIKVENRTRLSARNMKDPLAPECDLRVNENGAGADANV